jgi:hypothetical protein
MFHQENQEAPGFSALKFKLKKRDTASQVAPGWLRAAGNCFAQDWMTTQLAKTSSHLLLAEGQYLSALGSWIWGLL